MDLKNIRVITEIVDSQNSTLNSDEIKYIQNLYGEDFIKDKNIKDKNIKNNNINEKKIDQEITNQILNEIVDEIVDENIEEIVDENIEEIVRETLEERYVTDSDESDNNRFVLCWFYILHILSPIKNYKRFKKWLKS
jgi:restriction endonuclease Mrr